MNRQAYTRIHIQVRANVYAYTYLCVCMGWRKRHSIFRVLSLVSRDFCATLYMYTSYERGFLVMGSLRVIYFAKVQTPYRSDMPPSVDSLYR